MKLYRQVQRRLTGLTFGGFGGAERFTFVALVVVYAKVVSCIGRYMSFGLDI